MSFMSSCSKYFLCFFNFVFFVAGGAALTAGVWLQVDKSSLSILMSKVDQSDLLNKTDPGAIKLIAYILIAAGALTFIVSFLGYCGAMFESRCLLCIYGFLILIVLALECTVIGLAYGLKADAEPVIQNALKSTIKYYASPEDQTQTVTLSWDAIMSQMHCCGVNSFEDFHDNESLKLSGKRVPDACCIKENGELKDRSCPVSATHSNSYIQQGCYNAVVSAVKDNAGMIIIIGSSILFIELLVIIMAMYLACCYWRPQHACVDVSSRRAW